GYRLISTGIAFGSRTTVFEGLDTEIKFQYIETDTRILRTASLNHIHDQAPCPGAIQIKSQTTPLQEADKVIVKLERSKQRSATETRQRTCPVMIDRGMSLMTVETPQAALIAIYDLLEGKTSYPQAFTVLRASKLMKTKIKGLHFATSLIGENGPDPKAERLQTPLILIDFDMGEVLNDETKGGPKPRTGTPIFMAGVVRSGKINEGPHYFPPMPQLQAGLENYLKHLPSRLEAFPPNQEADKRLHDDMILEKFQHELRYDAESVFWLLLWWAIQAKPEASDSDEDFIPKAIWESLTWGGEKQDGRRYFIDPFPKKILHPSYRPLETLLRAMSLQLAGDLGLMESRSDPEYLHEAFQRLIFEFLSEHSSKNSDFLILTKSRRLRE
ncbi:11862_t:CDS:2, partial [Acaulospora colombiana]